MKDVNLKVMGNSTVWTIILIVAMTIFAELNHGFKDGLKALAGHHWVAKGIISVIFFVVLYFVLAHFAKNKKEDVAHSVKQVMLWTIIGGLVIFLFYVYEFFA